MALAASPLAALGCSPRGLTEADELARFLVPEHEPDRFEAAPQRQPPRRLKLRIGLEAGAKTVVRNAARQVMDVVIADRSGEPMQETRQIIERATPEGRGMELQISAGSPIGVPEL